ncbi:hypothetical protein FQN57_007170 [Myotisia sp. PD_48]|nr:hypothetical protein FQN57_007170 [Myotisia sp. PD_48]
MAVLELLDSHATPVSSGIFIALAIVSIFAVVLALLRYYLPLRTTPAYIVVSVFLALALPASAILLVPIDLASSPPESASPSGIWLSSRVTLVLWRITYWLTFVLTWVILPFLGQYLDSGYRIPKDRMLYSIRSNGRYQLFVFGASILGLIYIVIQHGFDFTSIKSLAMALAYVWGLVLAIYLMGHGLVSLPRRMWRNVNTQNRLRRIETQAVPIHDLFLDSVSALERVQSQVNQLQRKKSAMSLDMQDWVDELAEIVRRSEIRSPQLPGNDQALARIPDVITDRYMANLTRDLNRAGHQHTRFMDTWYRLVREYKDCKAIIDSSLSNQLVFDQETSQDSAHAPSMLGARWATPYTRYLIYAHFVPAARVLLAGLYSTASVCVVWSELIKGFAPSLSIVGLSVTKTGLPDGQVGFLGEIITSLWILYMCSAAFAGINDAKVWGNRALVTRNTYGESACWYAGQIARLTVPLAYNFLTLLPREVQHRTTFFKFLGQYINLTPLGKGFDYFFPMLILVPVLATMFNMYGRIKNIFGFGLVDKDDDIEDNPSGYGFGGWREGRTLIEQELDGPGYLGLSSRTTATNTSTLGSARARDPASRAAPTIRAPPSQNRLPRRSVTSQTAQGKNIPSRQLVEEEEEEDNFFQSFAHRVKNTIETTDKPKWLQDAGSGFKRPKWMGGSPDDEEPSSSNTFGRLFGGSPTEGRVRL